MKKFVILAVVIVALAGGGVLFLSNSLNGIVKAAMETHGTRVAGSDVRVSSVDIDLRPARGAVGELTVANPDGFSGRPAISLGGIEVDLNAEDLKGEPFGIEEIRVTEPFVRLELDGTGSTNLDRLKENVEAYAPKSSGDAPAPRIRVKRFVVSGGTLALDASAMGGKESERPLPEIVLTNVGGSEGVPADQAAQELLRAVLRQSAQRAVVDELKNLAGDKLGDSVGDAVGGILDKLGGS